MKIALCLLTLNGAPSARPFLKALEAQSGIETDRLLVDSSSNDGTATLFSAAGFRCHKIPRENFNHGATRRLAVALCPEAEIIIFMTQDAILATPDSLRNLIAPFSDPSVGAVYGRQLPAPDAGPIEAHARLFNYPSESRIKGAADIPLMGIKTAFISNSFAAYRCEALRSVGGFPSRTIIGEDTFAGGKIILAGGKVAYCAQAQVFHSHRYSFTQEWQRYFDTGVFHAQNSWLRAAFGNAEGEGLRFFTSEIGYLARHCWPLIPSALLRLPFRYLGFRAGLLEKYFPAPLKKHLSLQKAFWGSC